MNKIKNTQEISKITMYPIAFTKCEIGGDWYKNKLEIVFVPNICYPDYIEVQDWIMENIDGTELNIEDVVNNIYLVLQEEYAPRDLHVKDTVENCRTHFNVIVEK